MKLVTLIISAALNMIITIASAAEGDLYWKRGGEEIRVNSSEKTGCTLISRYDKSFIIVNYQPNNNDVLLGFSEKNATSITDGQQVNLKMTFVINNRLDEEWGTIETDAAVLSGGERFFSMKLDAKDFLRDFAKATIVAFYTEDDTLIGAFKLNGSMTAVQKLRACAFQQAGLNPNDPFLK